MIRTLSALAALASMATAAVAHPGHGATSVFHAHPAETAIAVTLLVAAGAALVYARSRS